MTLERAQYPGDKIYGGTWRETHAGWVIYLPIDVVRWMCQFVYHPSLLETMNHGDTYRDLGGNTIR